jgi:hypothetical protein
MAANDMITMLIAILGSSSAWILMQSWLTHRERSIEHLVSHVETEFREARHDLHELKHELKWLAGRCNDPFRVGPQERPSQEPSLIGSTREYRCKLDIGHVGTHLDGDMAWYGLVKFPQAVAS